jgi:DNA uptake protein ComE-like DNA-binding protein
MTTFRSYYRSTICCLAAAALLCGAAVRATAADTKAGTKTSEKPALVDLNTATAEELEAVPGIGAAYAKKIIDARPYASVKELSKSGIPAARLRRIEALVTVAEKSPSRRPIAKTGTAGDQVDINTATQAELEKIKGVNAAYAKKIIAGRPYASVKELSKSGIPASRLASIIPQVTVSKEAASDENVGVNSRASERGPASASSKSRTKSAKSNDTASAEARTPPQKGMVWVNTSSKVYHVEGDRWYGKTKKGEWMTEDDAIKAGYHKSKQTAGN